MWKLAIQRIKEQTHVLDSIQSRKHHTALATCFRHWRLEYKARQFAVLWEEKNARTAKVIVLAAWKGLVADANSEKQTQRELLAKVISPHGRYTMS